MPYGTGLSLCQDVESRIVVSIKHHATTGTDVGAHTQRLFNECATSATFLAGELWCYRNDRNIMHDCIVLDPSEECPPSGIVNALGKLAVPDHVAYLEVFIGNQIV